MSRGLLILSNLKKLQNTLEIIKKHVKNVYIHLNIEKLMNPPLLSGIITKIYHDSAISKDLDIRVLVTPLKHKVNDGPINKHFDYIFSDQKISSEICEKLRIKYSISKPTIFLEKDYISDLDIENPSLSLSSLCTDDDYQIYDTVVLGGTFDRIHTGHKILLTEAVIRAHQRVVVGVTDENMITSKILHELILPIERRIQDVKEFLNDIDSSLQYDIVPIQDPFGPTKDDPNMDLIIVSSETLRGGNKINELRISKNLKPLKLHCISMVPDNHTENNQCKESKISSSNRRMDLLGTRIKAKQPKQNLPERPYIIGLCGGIASGKTRMGERFENFGALVVNCDKLAHEIYEPGKKCYKKLLDYFGSDILGDDKRIDRKKLGSIVFENSEKLQKLNEIVWPEILIEAKQRINEAYKKNKFDVAILEAAVLIKAGWESECHEIWSMIISQKEAIKRLEERNNLTEEEARKRLNSQPSNKEFIEKSNVIFSSEWTHEFTQEQAERAWKMLMKELHNNN